MGKVKRFLTEQEDRLVNELRDLESGSITQEAINAAIKAVKEQRGFDTAFYNRGELSVDAFMRGNFGIEAAEEQDDEQAQMFLIDFQQRG